MQSEGSCVPAATVSCYTGASHDDGHCAYLSHCDEEFTAPCVRAARYSLQQFLPEQAVFFAERLLAERPCDEEALRLLAEAHLQGGNAGQARAILREAGTASSRLRYLLAVSCFRAGCTEEVEGALRHGAPGRAAAAAGCVSGTEGASGSRAASRGSLDGLAGGAAGLFLLGQAKERLHQREQAVECYAKCLEVCPFMWSAFERLSWLSLAVPTASVSAAGSAKDFANIHFSDERLSRDEHLRPPFRAAAAHTAAWAEGLTPGRRAASVVAAGAGAPKKRRRKDVSAFMESPPKVLGRRSDVAPPHDTCPGVPSRVPLADRTLPASGFLMEASKSPDPPSASSGSPQTATASASVEAPTRRLAKLTPRHIQWTPLTSPPVNCALVAGRGPSPVHLERGAPLGEVVVPDLNGPAPFSGRPNLPERAQPSGVSPCNTTKRFCVAAMLRLFGEALHAIHCFRCEDTLRVLGALPPSHWSSPFVQSLVARSYFELAEYQKAVEVYRGSFTEDGPREAAGLEYYSTALWHLRDSPGLGALAQRVVEWDRRKPEVWCVVGNSFSLQREHDQAVRCFRRAIQLDSRFVYAYTLIGHEFSSSEKYDDAIQMYERAIALDSRHYNAWWGLGSVYSRQEEHHTARYHFQRAADISAHNAVLRTSLGMACQALGEPERALELLSSVSRSGSQCGALASFHRGSVLEGLGRHREAAVELQRAQVLAPREPSVHFQLGRAHAGLRDTRKALTHFAMAMDLCGGARGSKEHQLILSEQTQLLQAANDVCAENDVCL